MDPAKAKRAIELIDAWSNESGDYDEKVWPLIEAALRESAPIHFKGNGMRLDEAVKAFLDGKAVENEVSCFFSIDENYLVLRHHAGNRYDGWPLDVVGASSAKSSTQCKLGRA